MIAIRFELFCDLTEMTYPYTVKKKRHFVPNRYIYLNQCNVEAMKDTYLLQSEFVVGKHILLLFQIVPVTLNCIICFKQIYLFGTKWRFLQCRHFSIVREASEIFEWSLFHVTPKPFDKIDMTLGQGQ